MVYSHLKQTLYRVVYVPPHIILASPVMKPLCFSLYLQDFVEPIYFYVGAVFGLQAVYVTALFVCSWVMSGTWVAGMLAVAWYVINR